MTDNRTTELREKLDALGIKHTDASYKQHIPITVWTVDGATFCYVDGLESTDLHIDNATPEQAVAATMGSEREKRLEKLVRIYGEIANYFCERFACCDAEFANCKYCIGLPQGGQCELGWCNDESNALGIEQPDYGGGECEPVNLEELFDKISELENTHGTLTADDVLNAVYKHGARWQAIADELNAELGSGTCELREASWDDGTCTWGVICSACGAKHEHTYGYAWNFAPCCGKAVER